MNRFQALESELEKRNFQLYDKDLQIHETHTKTELLLDEHLSL